MASEKRLIDANVPLRKIQAEIEKIQEWRDKKADGKDAVLYIHEIYKLDNWLGVYAECEDLIKFAPTVDAVEVVHGRWDDDRYDPRFICSECGAWFLVEDASGNMDYCPNCGAKMDGERKDNG